MEDMNINDKDKENIPETENVVVEKKSNFSIWREVWEWFYTILIALVIAIAIKMFLFDIVRVDGPSMYPTLVNNDRLIVTKIGYKPQPGDIVILDSSYKNRQAYYKKYEDEHNVKLSSFSKFRMYFTIPDDLLVKFYVKRIIGMPGDVIDIQNGSVLVNGEVLDEPYYDGITGITDPRTEYPFTVSDDCVFVMGDNRPNSKDSRSTELGEVPIKAVKGKSQIRLWPFSEFGVTK